MRFFPWWNRSVVKLWRFDMEFVIPFWGLYGLLSFRNFAVQLQTFLNFVFFFFSVAEKLFGSLNRSLLSKEVHINSDGKGIVLAQLYVCILACAEIQEAFWNELNWMIRAGMFHHLYLHSAKLCPRLPVEINPGPDERCQQVGQDKQIQFQCVKQLTKQEGLRFLASFNYLIAPSKITTPICFLSNGLEYLQSNSCLYRRCFPSCWGWLSRVSTATTHGG